MSAQNLDISYSNTRFNDNFNTKPEEKISLMYQLEYLGFLSEGENNLFNFKMLIISMLKLR